jgi:spermidine synthase
MTHSTDLPDAGRHVEPFIIDSRGARSLHFSISEIQSRMQLDDPIALDLEYTRTMMAFLLFVPEPRHIAMVGLGGGSLAKFCHHHLTQASVKVVEINPHVIALRDEFQVPPDGERFVVQQGDGARFVRHADAAFDVLIIDGFDWTGMPEDIATQRFYDDCHGALQPGGIMVVNLHRGDARYDVVVDRMRRSFDGQLFVVDDSDGSNSIVFASQGKAIGSYRPGLVRPPPGVDAAAARKYMTHFGKVVAAWRTAQRG